MAKRTSYEVKEKIIQVLRESPATYAQLKRKVNTGYRTIKQSCQELEKYGVVEIEESAHHPSNGRKSYKVKLTAQGRKKA